MTVTTLWTHPHHVLQNKCWLFSFSEWSDVTICTLHDKTCPLKMSNPRSSVLVYHQIHNGRVKIWLVLTAEFCTSFAVSCAYCWWLAIKKCMYFHLLTDVTVYEDFLKICRIKEVRPVLLSEDYSKLNTGEFWTPSPTVNTAHMPQTQDLCVMTDQTTLTTTLRMEQN